MGILEELKFKWDSTAFVKSLIMEMKEDKIKQVRILLNQILNQTDKKNYIWSQKSLVIDLNIIKRKSQEALKLLYDIAESNKQPDPEVRSD